MKVAVCDDEAIFVDRICALLERWAQKRNLCLSLYRFSDGDALLETHLSEVMDLIFWMCACPLSMEWMLQGN